MTDRDRIPEAEPLTTTADQRRWVWPTVLTVVIVAPIVILIFSNLEATEVSWAGFRFDQPLWVVLVVTFIAGMIGGKVAGWAWRRWRRRRRRLKEELQILRKHGADPDDETA